MPSTTGSIFVVEDESVKDGIMRSSTESNWGLRVEELRKNYNIKKKTLALNSNLTQSFITRITKGESTKPGDTTIRKLAAGFHMPEQAFREYVLGKSPPIQEESPQELLERALQSLPQKVGVYKTFPYNSQEAAIDTIWISRIKKTGRDIRAYVVQDDSIPEFHFGEYIIVDHVKTPDDKDWIAYIKSRKFHIGKCKIIDNKVCIEASNEVIFPEKCTAFGVIIGTYRNFNK